MSLTEDDVIKKRLLIEGDSGNEDRCVNKLIKLFIKWSKDQDVSGQEGQQDDEGGDTHDMMSALMSHIEFGLMRNQFILEMNSAEQDNYESLYKTIDQQVSTAKQDIIKYKQDLQHAKKIRKNKQEYDVLAKEILKYADRVEMESTIERLNKQLDELKDTKQQLNHKIDVRRKQFSVVLGSLNTLKGLIENEQLQQQDGSDAVMLQQDDGDFMSTAAATVVKANNDDKQDAANGGGAGTSENEDDDRQSVNSDRVRKHSSLHKHSQMEIDD